MSRWTTKDKISDELLSTEFVQNKKNPKDIALEYQISIHSVKHRIRRLKLKRKRHDLDKETLYNEYIIKKRSITEIALDYGLTPKGSTVSRLLNKYGIASRAWTNSGKIRKSREKNKKGFKGISGSYYCIIETHARYKARDINITPEYIWWLYKKQKARCAYSGVKIFMAKSNKKWRSINQTASLDRIDSSNGYIKGNVQWVHKTIQRMKWSLSDSDFINWCNLITKNGKRRK